MHLLLQAVRFSASLAICAALLPSVLAEPLAASSGLTRSRSQLTTQLPQCSVRIDLFLLVVSCFESAVNNSTCSASDLSCICQNQSQLLKKSASCALSNCTIAEELKTEKVIKTACGEPTRNDGNKDRAIFWSLFAVTMVSFGCRMLARTDRFGGTMWWDDYFIVASSAVAFAVTIGAEIMVIFGLGQEIWMLSPTQITVVLVLFYIAEFAYVIESSLTKISIVCLYLRIFPKKGFRHMCFALLALISCFCLVFVVSLLCYCQPFSYVWTRWDGRMHGKCIDMTAQTWVCAAMNIVLDVFIFLLPIPQLLKLETNWKTKIGVILVFLLGLFVTICSIARLRFLSSWASSPNPTYDYSDLALWSLIELYAGVICACLPGMTSLFRRIKHQHTEKKKSSAANSMGGSRMFTGASSGLRSFAKNEVGIVKTTNISVSYGQRSADSLSDEVELMDREMGTSTNPRSNPPPQYTPSY
ncbi:hypothetical protein INS49_010343 [Diaporthe citri]|uniref:uncharacterized protein n=1 Tax=Diaporthe citri TaxID=83186 RepID=UPI001C8188E1|nr:uncharacterized protein INS49_010343 [Diaporthe citri]KAG6362114.1 hypothetical protein INS49_010343 [Diaporthe citri]